MPPTSLHIQPDLHLVCRASFSGGGGQRGAFEALACTDTVSVPDQKPTQARIVFSVRCGEGSNIRAG